MLINGQKLQQLAKQTGKLLAQQGLMLVSAESCTGGWLGQTITTIPGSSKWYERGFITYSNISKQEMLGIDSDTLEQYGAVSEQTAKEMVAGAISRSHAQVGVSITGIAGPDGGTTAKPVGMICFGWALKDGLARNEIHHLNGDREMIRSQAVAIALQGVIALVQDIPPAIA